MHIDNVDLNLLKALAVLLDERHVSRAAERAHLTQSAMSRALQRLRDTFDDELLVRFENGYELTPRARTLMRQLEYVMPRLESMIQGGRFDPTTATDTFRVHCTDYATSVLGRRAFPRLFREAPHLSLAIEPLSPHSFDDVERGRIDLALTPVAPPRTLMWQTLFHEDFVCMLSSDHPVRDDRLTLDHLAHYPHASVVVLPPERMLVDHRLSELGVRPPSGLSVPYFTAAMTALPGTRLIATLPRRLAQEHVANSAIRIAEAPPELRPFAYGMTWHPRLTGDPAHTWLRGAIAASGRELDEENAAAGSTYAVT